MRQPTTEELLKLTACEICEYLGYDKIDDQYYGILQTLNDCIGATLDMAVFYEERFNNSEADPE